MKTNLSETLKENGIDFAFPVKIKDANGNETYYENSDGYREKHEYDANGKETYYENSNGFWSKHEYDANGSETYSENSYGLKRVPSKSQSCDGKIIEVDGKKYKLQEL